MGGADVEAVVAALGGVVHVSRAVLVLRKGTRDIVRAESCTGAKRDGERLEGGRSFEGEVVLLRSSRSVSAPSSVLSMSRANLADDARRSNGGKGLYQPLS